MSVNCTYKCNKCFEGKSRYVFDCFCLLCMNCAKQVEVELARLKTQPGGPPGLCPNCGKKTKYTRIDLEDSAQGQTVQNFFTPMESILSKMLQIQKFHTNQMSLHQRHLEQTVKVYQRVVLELCGDNPILLSKYSVYLPQGSYQPKAKPLFADVSTTAVPPPPAIPTPNKPQERQAPKAMVEQKYQQPSNVRPCEPVRGKTPIPVTPFEDHNAYRPQIPQGRPDQRMYGNAEIPSRSPLAVHGHMQLQQQMMQQIVPAPTNMRWQPPVTEANPMQNPRNSGIRQLNQSNYPQTGGSVAGEEVNIGGFQVKGITKTEKLFTRYSNAKKMSLPMMEPQLPPVPQLHGQLGAGKPRTPQPLVNMPNNTGARYFGGVPVMTAIPQQTSGRRKYNDILDLGTYQADLGGVNGTGYDPYRKRR